MNYEKMTTIETKIKKWLEDEIQSSREVIAEYTDNHRLKCDDGSDDFIEGNYHTRILHHQLQHHKDKIQNV